MGVYQLRISRPTPSLNEIIGVNPFSLQKGKKAWFWLIRASPDFLAIPKATGPRRMRIERYGKRLMDLDNLIGGAKMVLTDNLRKMGLLVDDTEALLKIEATNGKLQKGETPYTLVILEEI